MNNEKQTVTENEKWSVDVSVFGSLIALFGIKFCLKLLCDSIHFERTRTYQ